MTIVELFDTVGADNLSYQKLDECAICAARVRGGTNITFGTSLVGPENFAGGTRTHFGFVVWVPQEHVERVQAMLDAEARR